MENIYEYLAYAGAFHGVKVSTLKTKLLLATLCILSLCILLCVGIRTCSPSLIPPSEEEISPIEDQRVEYVVKLPGELGKLLFSYEYSDQWQNNWAKYRGKWVVWSGQVIDVIPKFKPIKVVFVYNYETPPLSFSRGEFGVRVNFSQPLRHPPKKGDNIYYRAKLAQRKTLALWEGAKYKYGEGLKADLLELEDGEILCKGNVCEDNVAARLADFAYTTYDQLDNLVGYAEKINSIKQFFEKRVKLGKKQIVIEQILKLFNIDISDKYWLLEEEPLKKLRCQKCAYRQDIERALQAALLSLHYDNIPNKQSCLKKITDALKTHKIIAESCKDIKEVWEVYYEQERKAAQPGIEDLFLAILSRLHPILGVSMTVAEGLIKSGKLSAYQIALEGCIAGIGYISDNMKYVRNNALEVIYDVSSRSF